MSPCSPEDSFWPPRDPHRPQQRRRRPSQSHLDSRRRPRVRAGLLRRSAWSARRTSTAWRARARASRSSIRRRRSAPPAGRRFNVGLYQTTTGTQNHRSHRKDGYRLPRGRAADHRPLARAGLLHLQRARDRRRRQRATGRRTSTSPRRSPSTERTGSSASRASRFTRR